MTPFDLRMFQQKQAGDWTLTQKLLWNFEVLSISTPNPMIEWSVNLRA